jgi:hypothetical protein
MSTGFRNNLAKQMAEHLVCVELGRRDLVATPFSGNVPNYDVLVADSSGRALPIQVKATRGNTWPSNARSWMDIELDLQTGVQKYIGLNDLPTPDLVYVCVALAPVDSVTRDRFFILTMADLQAVCVRSHTAWMDQHGWKRPRKVESFDLRYKIEDLEKFEDNWALISRLMQW